MGRMLFSSQHNTANNDPFERALANRGQKFKENIFTLLVYCCAFTLPTLLVFAAYELTTKCMPTVSKFGISFLFNHDWNPVSGHFGALPFLYGTAMSSGLSLLIASFLGLGTALFLTEFSPRWIQKPLIILIQIISAIPSVVWGLWALFELIPWLQKYVVPFLKDHLGFLPFFQGNFYGVSMLSGSLVVAIMILPIMISVTIEMIKSVPSIYKEAVFALGSTHWESIRIGVLPFIKKGLLGVAILGLGRAIGEAMAVTMVIGNKPEISLSLLSPAYTLSSVLANEFAESTSELHISALYEIALLLGAITIVVNLLAQLFIHGLEPLDFTKLFGKENQKKNLS
ncbi:phosphate ABC transporter permease subunit PstC [Methylacidiphilum sp. Yel]|uniref:phosphate ABC transporter permease subunit PstC n=1 Tax=Methylacidiphilum sp. Yel TaxID=1847730 RepID=UPI00106CCD96|nr:phosphate ABC transporter permease subunit PstC [Methylacidiphilum sp. Yel]TFE68700.1 phosphate ABC transporter permease subunit PstC [Methylacidiphilum sp. Yel]